MNKGIKYISVPLCVFLAVACAHAEDTPRSSMRKGLKLYKANNYTNAVEHLEKTVLEFPGEGNYNLGNALYRQQKFAEAEKAFMEALQTTDLDLQAKAYYNRGNALLGQTTQLNDPEKIADAIVMAGSAVEMFENSLLLNPKDLDAKCNYEKARKLHLNMEFMKGKRFFELGEAQLLEFKAKEAKKNYELAQSQFEHLLENVDPNHLEAKQLLLDIAARQEMFAKAIEDTKENLATALRQIEEYQYMLAAQRLMTETDNRKYAFDIDPELKKKYEETIQKNQEVLKIIQELSSAPSALL